MEGLCLHAHGTAGVKDYHMDVSAYSGIYILLSTHVSLFTLRTADSRKRLDLNESHART